MGRNKSFADQEELLFYFEEYLQECRDEKKFANLAGFARKCYCSKETLFRYKEETHPFCDAMKLIYTFLEDDTINNDMTDQFKKFYMTNTFRNDYRDKQEIESNNTNTNLNKNADDMSVEEIQAELAEKYGYNITKK